MVAWNTGVTIVGVVMLGISSVLNWEYTTKVDTSEYQQITPTILNLVVTIYIIYAFTAVSVVPFLLKLVVVILLIGLSYLDINNAYKKPTTKDMQIVSQTGIVVGAVLRLYFLIALNSDLGQSFMVLTAKKLVQDAPKQAEKATGPPFNRVVELLSDALKKTELTPEEIQEQKNKLRVLYNMPPKGVALTGGR